FIFFCFSRISLAPRSTLFPYTTLFRSDLLDQGSLDLVQGPGLAEPHGDGKGLRPLEVAGVAEVNVGLTVEFARFEVSPFVKGHFSAPGRGRWIFARRIRQGPFHFVVRDHALARRLREVGKSRLLPFGL